MDCGCKKYNKTIKDVASVIEAEWALWYGPIKPNSEEPKSLKEYPAFRLSKTKHFHDEIISQNYFNKGKTYDAKNSLGYQISKIEAFDIDNEVDLTLAEAISNTSYIKTSETKS